MKFIKSKLQWEQSVIFCGTLWFWIAVFALYGLMWVALNEWSYQASYGLVAFHGHGYVWPHLTWYGVVWPSVVLYGLLWQNIVFSRGHRSKFIWSCFYQRSIFVKIIFTANFDQMLRFLPIQESTADFSSDEMNHWIIKVFSNQLKTDIFDTFLKRFEGTAKI